MCTSKSADLKKILNVRDSTTVVFVGIRILESDSDAPRATSKSNLYVDHL